MKKNGLPHDYIFTQDNHSKHVVQNTRLWYINPIENVWHNLQENILKHPISYKADLRNVIQVGSARYHEKPKNMWWNIDIYHDSWNKSLNAKKNPLNINKKKLCALLYVFLLQTKTFCQCKDVWYVWFVLFFLSFAMKIFLYLFTL